jgi:predicted transcriptional regulator
LKDATLPIFTGVTRQGKLPLIVRGKAYLEITALYVAGSYTMPNGHQKLVNRRSKVKMYFEVLDLFYQEGTTTGEAHVTSVARQAKIPYDRFQKIVSNLIANNLLLRTKTGVTLTADGLCCLQKMRQANEFFQEMGLNI